MTTDLNHHDPTTVITCGPSGCDVSVARRVHPALSDATAQLRAVAASAWLTWAATYLVLALLAERGLGLVDCLGLATTVTALVLVMLGGAWACGGESATIDPALWIGGQARRWGRPWVALNAFLPVACVAATAWRLL